jgi:hypothetical protein
MMMRRKPAKLHRLANGVRFERRDLALRSGTHGTSWGKKRGDFEQELLYFWALLMTILPDN